MGVENFIAFLITATVFVVTPGMDTLFVLNKSIGQGRRSGIYAGLGINLGVAIHTLIGALGLSVVIAQSPLGFTIVKYAGAFYILYLGIAGLRSRTNVFEQGESPAKRAGNTNFWSGFITNVLNPKVALFFMAFFPQFILPERMESPIPFLILGATYAVIGIVWLMVLAFFAGSFSEKIKQNPTIGLKVNKITGVVFIGMAAMVMVM